MTSGSLIMRQEAACHNVLSPLYLMLLADGVIMPQPDIRRISRSNGLSRFSPAVHICRNLMRTPMPEGTASTILPKYACWPFSVHMERTIPLCGATSCGKIVGTGPRKTGEDGVVTVLRIILLQGFSWIADSHYCIRFSSRPQYRPKNPDFGRKTGQH